jgi:hypothetical protein
MHGIEIEDAFTNVAEAIRARGEVPEEVIIGLEMLRGSVDRWLTGESGALSIPTHARWAVTPSGTHIDLARRPTLRRLVMALLESRLAEPGASVSNATLIAAGWPNEQAGPEASANRLRVAICRLRQLGLENAIVTTSAGWMLDPNIAIVREENASTMELPTAAQPTTDKRESGIFVQGDESSTNVVADVEVPQAPATPAIVAA